MALIVNDIHKIMEDNMIKYYKEILTHRAIPDVRDGLMEVQRRTLYGAYEIKAYSSKPYIKSAKIVAAGLGRHPHGDSALYMSATNMAQYWKNHIMMLDKHGSVGSPYGDEPAAMRYLEMRLHKNAEELMLDGINTNCVDFKKTFDEADTEPKVLPAKLPFYLINGAFGISGGYSVNVPLHNPKEVISEILKYMEDPNHTIYLRPDIPTGGVILDDNNLSKAYTEGKSTYKMRALIEKDEKKHKLIIKELPYMVTLNALQEQLKTVTQKQKDGRKKEIPALIPGISSIDNNSAQGDVELHINVKNGYSLDMVESQLYKYTSLQVSIPFIMVGVKNDEFKIYNNVTEVIDEWLEFRRATVKRNKFHYIKQWNYRIHIIDGLLIILDPKVIDTALKKIRAAKGKADVERMLMEDYNLSSKQASYVSNLPLYRISNMSVSEFKTEKAELKDKLDDQLRYMKDPKLLDEYIMDELRAIDANIKCPRRTKLVSNFNSIDEDDVDSIPDKEYALILTSQGYVKKRPPIKEQKRNGKGYTLGTMKDGDYPVVSSNFNEKDFMYICTNAGKMYKFEVREFPETGTKLGVSIKGRINGERITSCMRIPRDINEDEYNVLIVTKLNKIKQTPLSEFKNINNSGIIASKLADGDEVIGAVLVEDGKDSSILIANSLGNTLFISANDIPKIGRTTMGSNAFSSDLCTKDGGYIASVDVYKDEYTHAITISSNGLGKLVEVDELYSNTKDGIKKLQGRGQKGILATKLKDNSVMVSCKFCTLEEQVTIISKHNMISINTADISVYKRPTYGLSMMNIEDGDAIVEITIP